jgi:hypothetical protein
MPDKMRAPANQMKTSILWAVILAVVAPQGEATVFSSSNDLFEHYAVSASQVVGSGYIRFYGPTNEDYNSVFTGWFVTQPSSQDLVSEDGYPAYDSIEALDLEGTARASDQIQPDLAVIAEDSYTLLLAYAINPVCIGDANSAACSDPGKDISVTVSSTVMSGGS